MIWVVEDLRGIASLAVVFFHFKDKIGVDWLASLFSHGRLGVHAFFVISGFVMPMALARSGYRLRDFPRFVSKRVVRLDPPYFLCILLVLGLKYLPHALLGIGEGSPWDWNRVVSHLLYLTGFLGYEWLNPVFWTLALEFQFYLALGMLFPLLRSRTPTRLALVSGACCAGPLMFEGPLTFLPFLPLFGLGLVALWWRQEAHSRLSLAASALLLSGVAGWRLGWGVGVVGIATALLIAGVTTKSRHLGWLGAVSYSLYLVHIPLGELAARFVKLLPLDGSTGIVQFMIPVLGSLAAAFAFYQIIELPSRRWAAAISYRSSGTDVPMKGRE